ncbi:MAG: hypothetical protein IPO07_14000 [Haliscomenobacter sp.]|nr:hypothetical protein [Haliscomenobacter sp.]MBK9489760.1 hypothetical protein [Haliscomenobacter sp.]
MKYRTLYLLFPILFLNSACDKALDQFKDDALDGLQFEVSTGVLHQPLTLQMLDELSGAPAEGVSVELLSSDFSTIYTNSGSKTLRLQGGLLTLGTLKREAPSESAPRKVRFRFKSTGYFTREEEYLLSDTVGILATVWMRPMRSSEHIGMAEKTLSTQRTEVINLNTQNLQGSLQIDPYVEFSPWQYHTHWPHFPQIDGHARNGSQQKPPGIRPHPRAFSQVRWQHRKAQPQSGKSF